MKQQILMIHGGDTFETYEEYLNFLRAYQIDLGNLDGKKRWRDYLRETLGDDYEIIAPSMPSKYNARYLEWKIWFEKYFPALRDGIILIGTSLGGIFLAKYLSDHTFPVTIKATFLVAAPYGIEGVPYSAPDGSVSPLVDFVLPDSLELLESQGGAITLIHSTDDTIVKFSDMEEYAKKLPKAKTMVFNDRNHFTQETFPELLTEIRAFNRGL